MRDSGTKSEQVNSMLPRVLSSRFVRTTLFSTSSPQFETFLPRENPQPHPQGPEFIFSLNTTTSTLSPLFSLLLRLRLRLLIFSLTKAIQKSEGNDLPCFNDQLKKLTISQSLSRRERMMIPRTDYFSKPCWRLTLNGLFNTNHNRLVESISPIESVRNPLNWFT